MRRLENRMGTGALGRAALVLVGFLMPNAVMAQTWPEARSIFDKLDRAGAPTARRLGPSEVGPSGLISITRASHKVPKKAQALFERAVKQENRGRVEEALASLLDAIRLDPLYWDAHVHVATIQWNQGRKQSALDAINAALAIDANSEILLTNKAVALLDLGSPGAAEEAARSALSIEPTSGYAHYLIGLAQLRQGAATSETFDHMAKAIGTVPQAKQFYRGLEVLLANAR